VAERLDALIAFDRSTDVHQITIPKLVLGARDDLIVPSFFQEELATLFKDADLHLFDQGGHFFPVTRTQLFVPLVLEWLRASSSRISYA
jgi:pimeloyl-ACP methyl ester carboxylesterase